MSLAQLVVGDDSFCLDGFLSGYDGNDNQSLLDEWQFWARPEQIAPDGDWRVWLILAGRGFGKTRAGAEWVRTIAARDNRARIALLAANLGEARSVMVEGESGILAVSSAQERPNWLPSLRRLEWSNGAIATLYSAGEPDSLRGPQHSHAWCDEIAKWDNSMQRAKSAWDNLSMGLRLGRSPQICATTTPKSVPLVRELVKDDPLTVITTGRTIDNRANLPVAFMRVMERNYGGTTLGRQELDGELLQDVEGALWSRSLLEQCRNAFDLKSLTDRLVRVIVGVDPPVSAKGDSCGIVVVGQLEDGRAIVLADCSIANPSPEQWARAVAIAYENWKADRIIAEANQGGEMVRSVLNAAQVNLPVRLVHASRGKIARAEPVAALYEAGRVVHAAMLGELEDQLCGFMGGGEYVGPGRSPDRADAMVWALTALMLSNASEPKIRR